MKSLETRPAGEALEGIKIIPEVYGDLRDGEEVPSLSELLTEEQNLRWGPDERGEKRRVVVIKGTIRSNSKSGYFIGIVGPGGKMLVSGHACFTHPLHLSYQWQRQLVVQLNEGQPFSQAQQSRRELLQRFRQWQEDHYGVKRILGASRGSG